MTLKMPLETKRKIDKELAKYPRWVSVRNRCLEWERYLESTSFTGNQQDRLSELGTTIQSSRDNTEERKQIAFMERKQAVLNKKKDERAFAEQKIKDIETMMGDPGMSDDMKNLLSERYFKRKTMLECAAAVNVCERQYAILVNRIRHLAYDHGLY